MNLKKFEYNIGGKFSPYFKISKNRIKNTKFTFKKVYSFIRKNIKIKKNLNYLDVGCANGELLFYLSNNIKNGNFVGVDFTSKFLSIGKKLLKHNNKVSFECRDIFKYKIKKKFDVVTCVGTISIFQNIDKILKKLISLVAKNGILIIEGRFNKYKVDAFTYFKDYSYQKKVKKENDFNLHSEFTINKTLKKIKNLKYYFEHCYINKEIKKNKNIHSNLWTEKLMNNRLIIVNGLQIICNPSFLIIKKN